MPTRPITLGGPSGKGRVMANSVTPLVGDLSRFVRKEAVSEGLVCGARDLCGRVRKDSVWNKFGRQFSGLDVRCTSISLLRHC